MKLIIDTDIGSDIDDALALMYAVKADAELELVTTVHGDTELRAKIAKKLLTLLGADIPVHAGESQPIKQTHIFTTGLEGKDFIKPGEDIDIGHDTIDTLAECILQNRGNVNIAAIGPLTNLAKAFQEYPALPQAINHIYIMANAIVEDTHYHLNYRSHNLKVDPEAADIVIEADVPKTIITTPVCKTNYLTRDELRILKDMNTPATDYIYSAALEWMDLIKYDEAFLYDPLVVYTALYNSAILTKDYRKDQMSVSTDVKPGFKEHFLETIIER